jgi:2-C-methyl-D-erythritol 4-phosphate cytidylyltransferase
MSSFLAAILLAGGQGQRLGWEIPKQFIKIAGKTLLEHSYDCLAQALPDARIIVVVPADQVHTAKQILAKHNRAEIVIGGSSRQGSTLAGLDYLASSAPENVIIHDAARPFLSEAIIHDVIQSLQKYEAVDVAIPATDTIIVENEGLIQSIPQRSRIWRGQTPQAFRFSKLYSAYQKIGPDRLNDFTDDCGIFLSVDPFAQIYIVKGSSENIKITENLDLVIADELFRLRSTALDPNLRGVDVENKTAFVFGGTAGIGKAIAHILNEAGCATEVASRASGCDIRNYDDVKNALDAAHIKHKRIDYIINTAGTLNMSNITEQSADDVSDQIAVNLTGTFNIAKASHNILAESKGMLLNFSSSSYTRGRSGYVPYSACKAAIVNLTQGLADEWQDDGIRVNCIVPGRTDTAMRRTNFYNEDQSSLLSPYEVGLVATKVLNATYSGMVVRV